jgi:hypothetical protein
MAEQSFEEALDAYVQYMLDNHTRLVVMTVDSHEDEWAATKHAYPPEALQKLQSSRASAGWAPDLNGEFTSDPRQPPQALMEEDGTFRAESETCILCCFPLLTRPSMDGPFAVAFSAQVPLLLRAAATTCVKLKSFTAILCAQPAASPRRRAECS